MLLGLSFLDKRHLPYIAINAINQNISANPDFQQKQIISYSKFIHDAMDRDSLVCIYLDRSES